MLFDIDRTLLDTAEFINQAFEHALKMHATPVSREELEATIGGPLTHSYGLLAPDTDAAELIRTHREFQAKNLHLSKAFPNAKETLETLRGAGIPLAAITNRSKITSLDTLSRAGLSHLFDLILSAEDVENIKPHPEPLLKAISFMKADAAQSYMVGDTFMDVEAGKSAGTKTIAVSYGLDGARLASSNPDYLVHSIEEILPIVLGSGSVLP